MNVIAFDNDVAKIYADPKFKPMIRLSFCIAFSFHVLNVSGAAHCIDDTAEFHQQAVAHNLDETPAMRGDFRLEDLLQFGLETRARPLLVKLAKPGIADDISNKDGGETAFHYPSRFEAVIPFQAYRSSNPVAIRAPPTNRDLCSRRLSHATTLRTISVSSGWKVDFTLCPGFRPFPRLQGRPAPYRQDPERRTSRSG